MKENRSLTRSLVALGIAVAMVSTLAAQTVVEGTAKVVRKKGDARYSIGAGDWRPLQVGDVLSAGTVIQTSKTPGSFVDLVLGDGTGTAAQPAAFKPGIPSSMSSFTYQGGGAQNVVRVWENSALGLDKLTLQGTGADQVTETQLDLKAGRITGSVKKLAPASKYEVKLPNGVAGIRGTVYDITADGLIRVATGTVVVAFQGSDGQIVTRTINGGETFDTKSLQTGLLDADVAAAMIDATRIPTYVSPPTSYTRDTTVFSISPVQPGVGSPLPTPPSGGPPPVPQVPAQSPGE